MSKLNELVGEAEKRFSKTARDVIADLPVGELSNGELTLALARAAGSDLVLATHELAAALGESV
jgi:hypothetical protein